MEWERNIYREETMKDGIKGRLIVEKRIVKSFQSIKQYLERWNRDDCWENMDDDNRVYKEKGVGMLAGLIWNPQCIMLDLYDEYSSLNCSICWRIWHPTLIIFQIFTKLYLPDPVWHRIDWCLHRRCRQFMQIR